jgi:hypothetical protein
MPPCCLSMNATSHRTVKGEAKLLKRLRLCNYAWSWFWVVLRTSELCPTFGSWKEKINFFLHTCWFGWKDVWLNLLHNEDLSILHDNMWVDYTSDEIWGDKFTPLWLFDRLLDMALDLWCELLLVCLPSLYYSVIFGMRIWVMIFICVPFYPFGLKSKTYTWFLSRGDFVCHSWNEVLPNVVAIFFNVSIMWIFLCWKYM